MATVKLPRRLVPVLGTSDVGALTLGELEALVGWSEAEDLEVKRDRYGNGESDRRELAADVAAFANGHGGLLLIGAEESNEVITGLVPIDVAGEELRVRRIVASLISPPVEITTRSITDPDDASKGVLVVVVPASPRAPHAVVKNEDLRFAVRDGATKRLMRESEVADRYRSRFSAASSRLERLDAIHRGIGSLLDLQRDHAWLVLAGLPEVPGYARSSRQGLDATSAWLGELATRLPSDNVPMLRSSVTSGFRRYVAADGTMTQKGLAGWAAAQLHHDGGAVVALAVGHNWQQRDGVLDHLTVGDEMLAYSVISALLLVGAHAARVGGSGQLDVSASMVSSHPVQLGHTRSYGFDRQLGKWSLTEFEQLAHTFDLDEVAAPGPGLVAASFLVTSDIVAGFGHPESLQLTVDGAMRWNYISSDYRRQIVSWADAWGVEVLGRPS